MSAKKIEPEPNSHSAAVMYFGDKVGCLALTIGPSQTVLGLYSTTGQITHTPMQSPEIGRDRFQRSIENCEKIGFRLVFRGRPNNAELS